MPGDANASRSQIKLNVYESGALLIIGWTMILALVLIWNWVQISENTKEQGFAALRMTTEKDLTFRAWGTEHGGVYVPVTSENPPNPYLSHVTDHVVTTSAGRQLTLLNPAYMMRQVYEIKAGDFGIRNRLISLDPVNPINTPDAWETKALETLRDDKSITEVSAVTEFNEEQSMRLVRPFYIEKGCLKCHGHQGYQEGDLRGGISVVTPLAPHGALIRTRQLALLPGYGIIWLVGLVGIACFVGRLHISSAKLEAQEARNRALVRAIPDMLFRYSPAGVYLDAEVKPGFTEHHLIPDEIEDGGLIGQRVKDVLPTQNADNVLEAIEKVITTGEIQIVEHSIVTDRGRSYFEERLVLEESNTVMSIVRDVTSQKHFEAKLEYLSFHDELTGLNNRNYFETEFARLEREGEYPISIISTDVNGLKRINDTLGHAAGDELLMNCAKVLTESMRSSDILARVGGDEFVAILPGTGEKEGREVVARIRANVLKCNRNFPDIPLSLAVGMATAEKSGRGLTLAYKRADDAMYLDKRQNRAAFRSRMAKLLFTPGE